ncbi:gamma-aminobutyric acid type B receptor subunit 3 isoform X2 [Augochlora pura]
MGDEISSSGLTSSRFVAELARRGVTHSKFAAQTYDAVWAMALGLERTEALLNKENVSVAQYSHARKDIATRLLDQLKLLRFIGVSGPVSFDGADRVGITAFYQMYDHVIRRIAIFSPEDGKLVMNCPRCATTRWPGGHPPAARRVFRLRVVTVAPAAFLAVTCIASVGVTLALAFLAFNLHFRRHKSIKLSSPRLNNMAAVGCGLVYGAVILLGLDHATLPDSDDYYPAVCTARVYLLSAGFSLAFGSMFTKTYRVHRIFTKSRSGVVKNKLLQDTRLISLIFVLLLIDGLVVTLWVTFDPMQRHLRNLTLEINPQDRGVVYQPQVEVCHSQHTNSWLGALYVYKGLLLVVGVYMAWETRHVKIPALNDSQYIGMSVYFVVITSGIVVVLANLMSDRATLAFVTITALILASTTATLALLFLPQLANILAGERADPVVQSLGLKIECNTRRFVTDDKNELQYRVEVQNRVYRREMAQLELELARLEKQLAQEPAEPSHASSSASIPQRNPSIGGGLPLLLLSVLPPVIPRASWPSADPSGVASALRVHMGYIAGLVPGTKAASTCQVNAQGARPPHPRCGSGPIISITSEEDRRLSLGLRRKESSEPRVNFSLPPKASTSQSSSREKIRGSPRFPHRIVPANSLNAIASGSSISKSQRWHSMEDARKMKPSQALRGSSCSPVCDVWATREVGIPLNELGTSARIKKPPDSLALPGPADANTKTFDDARLGNEPINLPRANDVPETGSPAESEAKPASPSADNARTSDDKDVACSTTETCPKPEPDTSANKARDNPWLPSRPSSPIVHVTSVDELEGTKQTDREATGE